MDLAALIDYINLHIKPNGNREITANVLNPVLQAITEWANTQMGDLEDLNTTEKANLVAAINEVNNALAAININGSQVYYGTANPNVTPPPVFKTGDFYVQEDLFNVTVALFVYDGFTWRNLSGGNVGDPIRVWAQGDARIILKDQTYVNANFDAFGIGINNEVGWKIADFPNCVPVQQGSGVFANLGDTVGSKDAVNVSHSHNSAELSDGKKGVNALGTGTNTAGYILVEDAATAKIVKTSTEGVDGTDKNIQPSYVVLYVECLQDIWASGGGTTPNLTQVLAIDNKTNDIPIVSNNGKAIVDVNDDYTSVGYDTQTFAMTDTEVQLYSEAPVVFDSTVSTDFNTPVLNYNTEEVATKNWVTSQGYGTVTPSTLISTDADNALVLGLDNKLFVPESTGGGNLPYQELIFTAVQTAPQTGITSGTLIEGGRYTITNADITADFVISGAADNEIGTVFIANETPPDWGVLGELSFEGNPIVTILNNPLNDTYTSGYTDIGSYYLEGLLDFPLNTFPKYAGYVDVVQKSAEDFTGVGQSAYLWYKNPLNDKQIMFRSGVSGNLTDNILDGTQLFIVKIFNS